MHSSLLMTNDLMTGEETRRGIPCWYKNADVKQKAMYDAIMIKFKLYSILKKYFSGHHCYVPTLDLFNDVVMETAMGKSLNAMSVIDEGPNLSSFTMHRYNAIVKYNLACYSFQLPVALAMYLAGKYDPEMHRQAKTVLLEIAHFFQVQDDFLDCFGDPGTTGNLGTDIRKGECTWLAVVALQRASPEQRKILEDHYGKPNSESEAAVRNLYEELDLPNTYFTYREENLNLIHSHIQQIPKGVLDKLFFKFMNKV
ncbi:hypothetical protein ILUMI_19892 [Ignelater luminosus]|uniref:Farnesyl diphosphate synthase n=1 Tax=Ignelater luminosus TaxID=2038154 RepID=A0A8K0CIE9_IGNLU|nr:hypothetical protein ILUMI_19892 [Ignelater luminosus]